MSNALSSGFILALLLLCGCAEQAEYDSSLPTFPATSTSAAGAADTLQNAFTDTVTGAVPIINPQALPAATMLPASSKNTTALNPKHGEPGHRCDIAVGAPLNTPVQAVQQSTPVPQTLPSNLTPAINSTGTVKLNPPHGQPGHDCAIPVGEPLKG